MIRPWRSASRNSTPEISSMLWQRNQGIAKVLYHTASIAEIFVASPVDFRAPKVWMNLMQMLQFGIWLSSSILTTLKEATCPLFRWHWLFLTDTKNCMKPWFFQCPLSNGNDASVGLGCKRHLDSLPLLRQVLQRGLNVSDIFHDTVGGRKERKERTGSLGSSFKPSQKKYPPN